VRRQILLVYALIFSASAIGTIFSLGAFVWIVASA
jgi:hypothetical protein